MTKQSQQLVSLNSLARTAVVDDSRGVSLIPATEDTCLGWTTEAQRPTLLALREFDLTVPLTDTGC